MSPKPTTVPASVIAASDETHGDATLPLDEFLVAYEAGDNWWWLSGGHHQNLFEEAVDRMVSAETQLRRLTKVSDEECGDFPAPCNCDDPHTHNGHGST